MPILGLYTFILTYLHSTAGAAGAAWAQHDMAQRWVAQMSVCTEAGSFAACALSQARVLSST